MQRLLIVLGVLISLPHIYVGLANGQESPWARPLEKCWSFEAENLTKLGVASDNDKTILLPILHGTVNALDASLGKPLWSIKLSGSFISQILINENSLYLANATKRKGIQISSVYSVDIASGIVNWTYQLPGQPVQDNVQLKIDGDRLLAFGNNGVISSIEKTSVTALWTVNIGTSLSTNPLVFDRRIFVGTQNKTIVVLDRFTGGVIEQISVGIIPTKIAADKDRLFIGDQFGSVRALGLVNMQPIWKIRTGAAISGIYSLADRLLITSNDNFVYSFGKASGKSIWRRRLSGRILGNIKVDDLISVFLSSGSNEALLINVQNGKIVNRIGLDEQDYFTSSPIVIGDTLILPANSALVAYAPKCKLRR